MNRRITEDERKQLLEHGRVRAAGLANDPLPVVRLFTPDAHATWLLTSLDPVDGDTAYGLIDLGDAAALFFSRGTDLGDQVRHPFHLRHDVVHGLARIIDQSGT